MLSVYANSRVGQRLVVVYAGDRMGFILSAVVMSKPPGYHEEMDRYNFNKLVKNNLILVLSIGSNVMLDKAP
jgi:hypothetical protein